MRKATIATVAAALMFGASSIAMAQSSSRDTATPAPAMKSSPSSSSLSGSSSAPMNEAQVKQKLEADGYSNVSDVRKDKDGWTAKANHNGKQVTVDVDANGKIESK